MIFFFAGCGLGLFRDPVLFVDPGTEIDQAATLGTERPVLVPRPDRRLAALRAGYGGARRIHVTNLACPEGAHKPDKTSGDRLFRTGPRSALQAVVLLLFRRLGRFLAPVIQVVGDVVTLPAGRELLVHGAVRQAVAVGALHHRLVLVRMAGRAGDLAMLGLAGRQLGHDIAMAGRAHGRGGGRRVLQFQRLVRLVAELAVGLGHGCRVWLVAVDAGRDVAVLVGVAEVAGHGGVLAGVGRQLLAGFGMAGQADLLLLAGEGHLQGLVRVVAAEAVFDFVVGGAGVTVAALGDVLGRFRLVPLVAAEAVDRRLVLGAVGLDLGGLHVVAFAAVGDAEDGLVGGHGEAGRAEQQRRACQDAEELLHGHGNASLEWK